MKIARRSQIATETLINELTSTGSFYEINLSSVDVGVRWGNGVTIVGSDFDPRQTNKILSFLKRSGRPWRQQDRYSDTSANEDNSFRNHIR